MEGSPLPYLSHSRLSSYRQCSLKFRFQYVDKVEPAFVPAPLAFGVAFHQVVEEALVRLMAGDTPSVEELLPLFATAMDEQAKEVPVRCGENETPASMVELAERMLKAWLAWQRPAARIIAVEHEFRVPIAEWLPPLVGRIDLVEEHEDHIEIIDVKTSRGKWGEDDVAQHAGQLSLYRAAIDDLVREVGKPVKLGFEVITKTKKPFVERLYVAEVEPLGRQIRTATVVLEAIEKGVFIPSPSWQCASCPFAEACKAW